MIQIRRNIAEAYASMGVDSPYLQGFAHCLSIDALDHCAQSACITADTGEFVSANWLRLLRAVYPLGSLSSTSEHSSSQQDSSSVSSSSNFRSFL